MQSKISTLLAAGMATSVLSAAIDVCLPRLEQNCNFGVSGVVWEETEGGTVWWEGAFLHNYKCDLLGEVHGMTGDTWEVPSSGQSPTVFVTPKITQGRYGDITEMKFQAGKFIFDDKLDCYNEDVAEAGQHRIHCRTWYPCNPAEFKRSFRPVHGPRDDTDEKNTRQENCEESFVTCEEYNAEQSTSQDCEKLYFDCEKNNGEVTTGAKNRRQEPPKEDCEENYSKCEEACEDDDDNCEDACEEAFLKCDGSTIEQTPPISDAHIWEHMA